MTSIAGCFGLTHVHDVQADCAKMLATSAHDERIKHLQGPGWGIAIRCGCDDIAVVECGDAVVLFLDPASDEVASQARAKESAHHLLRAIDEVGAAAFAKYLDCGMCIVIDAKAKRLLLGVDRFGAVHLYYASAGGGVVFASSPAAVAKNPYVNDGLCAQAIYDYLYSTVVPAPGTVYKNVHGLLPGDALEFVAGQVTTQPVWRPEFQKIARIGSRESRFEHLRQLMDRSVAGAAEGL